MLGKFVNYICFLPQGWHFPFLIHFIVLIGILISQEILEDKVAYIQNKLMSISAKNYVFPFKGFIILLAVFSAIIIWYLSTLSFDETGFYHMILGSPHYIQALARESSLKLLENPSLRYVYSLLQNSLAPVLFILLIDFLFQKRKHFLSILGLIVSIIVLSNFTGTRSFILIYFLYILSYMLIRNDLKIKIKYFLLGSITVVFTIMAPYIVYYIKNPKPESFSQEYLFPRLERSFLVHDKVGLWYMHDAQTQGHDIYKLLPQSIIALIKPESTIHLGTYENYIGQKYGWFYKGRKTLDSISANASFIFVFYNAIGIWAIPLSIFLLLVLDFVLFFYCRLSPYLLLPLLSIVSIKLLGFVSSNYFTTLASFGIIPIIFYFYIADLFYKKND
jgi:hypothetical protein